MRLGVASGIVVGIIDSVGVIVSISGVELAVTIASLEDLSIFVQATNKIRQIIIDSNFLSMTSL